MMTRDEHLAWAKTRALEYVAMGDLPNALASMSSDLNKHPETHSEATDMLIANVGVLYVTTHNTSGMRRFIEGFH